MDNPDEVPDSNDSYQNSNNHNESNKTELNNPDQVVKYETLPTSDDKNDDLTSGNLRSDVAKLDNSKSDKSNLVEKSESLEDENPKNQKRVVKSSLERKMKKQKVLRSVVKESYLDTMAEESDVSGSEDDEEDEDDESEAGGDIPDELRDFITDEVVEEYEEEASDVEYDPLKFDEDDLELIAENTGSKVQKDDFDDDDEGNKRLRRLKKGTKKADPELDDLWYEEEANREFELSDVWATVAECFGHVDLVIQILKNERNLTQMPLEQYDSDYDPNTDPENEPTQPGNEADELVSKVDSIKISGSNSSSNLEQFVEVELGDEFLTKEDEEIRQVDEPERLYMRYRGRSRKVSERELQSESQWMTRRLMAEFTLDLSKESVKKAYENTFQNTFTNTHTSVSSDVAEKCELVLNWLLNERWEIPFILHHKRHLICPPLTDAVVWRIYQLDLEWMRLDNVSRQIQAKIDKIGHQNVSNDVLYYSLNFDNITDLDDVNTHLLYHFVKPEVIHTSSQQELKQDLESESDLQDNEKQDMEYEYDDIFGDFEPIENPVHNKSVPSTPNSPSDPVDLQEPDDNDQDDVQRDENDTHDEALETTDAVNDSMEESVGDGSESVENENDLDELMDENDNQEEAVELADEGVKLVEEGVKDEKSGLKTKKNSSLYLIENVERYGLQNVCSSFIPSADELYELLEKTLVNTNYREFKLNTPENQRENFNADFDDNFNFDIDINQLFSAHTVGPFTSSKYIFNSLIDYYCSKYSTHFSIRRLFREFYKNYCNLTCVTTIKGEETVEVSDKSWFIKRMAGLPVTRLLRASQIHYKYPSDLEMNERLGYIESKVRELKLVEMYLQILKLEENNEVNLVIHPQTPFDTLYHKSEQYNIRINNMYNTVSSNSGSNNYDADNAKNVINRELMVLNDLYNRDQKYLNGIIMQLASLFALHRSNKGVSSGLVTNNFFAYMTRSILNRLFHKYLIPGYRRYVKELLYQASINSVLLNTQQKLLYTLDYHTNPFSRLYDTVPNPPSSNVLSILNDDEGVNVYLCIYSENNAVYLNKFNNILKYIVGSDDGYRNRRDRLNSEGVDERMAVHNWHKLLLNLFNKYNINVVLLGLVNLFSLNLFHSLLHNVVNKVNHNTGNFVKLIKYNVNIANLTSLKYMNKHCYKPSGKMLNGTNFVSEDLNQFMLSISMCRVYRNFLLEFVNLWDENDNFMLKLNLHELQSMVSKDKLQEYTLHTLITTVNRHGVDVDLLVNYHKKQSYNTVFGNGVNSNFVEYLTNYVNNKDFVVTYLSLVSGLGIRKSRMLLAKLKNFVPNSRNNMLEIVGNNVFYNMISFIRFNQNNTVDSLDMTRIHPVESAYIAQKLCNGSLDERLTGEEAVQEILNNPTRLDELDLESYSILLNEKQDMKRILPYLLFIKYELQNPYSTNNNTNHTKDGRRDRDDDQEIFYNLMKLDKSKFKYGTNVLCKFNFFFSNNKYQLVLLPFQLRGTIHDIHQFKLDLSKYNKDQQMNLNNEIFYGRVMSVDFKPLLLENGLYNYEVEVCLTNHNKRSILNKFLNYVIDERLDEYLSPLSRYDITYNRFNIMQNMNKKKLQYKRNIRHPLYKIWNIQKVLAYLKQVDIPVGDCCICPMNELDKLNLVIKTCNDPFNYVSFVIYEKNQRVPGELGRELYLQNERYSNLDQVISQFVEILKLNLEEFYTHPKFRNNSDVNKVERDLIQESALKPDNITWAIIPSVRKGINNPLKFVLIVIPPGFNLISETKSLQDPIYVTHKAFRLWTHEEKSLKQLITWWKEYGYWHRNAEKNKFLQQQQQHNHHNNHHHR